MKRNKLFGIGAAALMIWGLSSCSNELNGPSAGRTNGVNSPVISPDVVAWSGNQTFTPGVNGSAATRGYFPNQNEYGNNYDVPAPLTEYQKDKVRRYFQTHQNPQGISLNFKDYFVQQVYKGNTNTEGSLSSESYTASNNSKYDSNQMNQLCAGSYSGGKAVPDEIGSFNSGTYNNGQPSDIWNGTENIKDMMMMMTNSSTEFFGYKNSAENGSYYLNQFVIIPGDQIMEWEPTGANVSGMYFVGLDFDLLSEDKVRTGEFVEINGIQYEYMLPEMNYYCADVETVNDSQQIINTFLHPEQFNDQQLNGQYKEGREKVLSLLERGYLPVKNKNEWVIYKKCADGYYSDWIIRITNGQKGVGSGHETEYNPGTTPDPEDNCDLCDHPSHEPGECPECKEGEVCNPKDDPNDNTGNNGQPEGDDTPELHADLVCDWCGHAIVWDEANGRYVHATPTSEQGDGILCGECHSEDTEHVCLHPEYNAEYHKGSNSKYYTKEVEINLSVNDIHELPNGGGQKYDIADLVSKLSIHVRYGHDVEVILPVPENIYCDQDDLYILQTHDEGMFKYGGDKHVVIYDIVEKPAVKDEEGNITENGITHHVELHIDYVSADEDNETALCQGYIKVWTVGITPNLIRYLKKTTGDGINFEIYNYFNRGTQSPYATNYPELKTKDELKYYLEHSIVIFDHNNDNSAKITPDFYINAFNNDRDKANAGEINDADCYVWIVGDERADQNSDEGWWKISEDQYHNIFWNAYQGPHYNGSDYNWIYTNKRVKGSADPTEKPMREEPEFVQLETQGQE